VNGDLVMGHLICFEPATAALSSVLQMKKNQFGTDYLSLKKHGEFERKKLDQSSEFVFVEK
jgi:hypothetical protein